MLSWISRQDSEELRRAARGGEPMLDFLARSFPLATPSLIRGLLSPAEMGAIARLSDRDFDAFLDEVLREAPEQGRVLWEQKAWYMEGMRSLQARLVWE